jgi:ABC-type oligopeptide transport system substrate-binding subunit
MNHSRLLVPVVALLFLLASGPPASAQPRDTLTVALVSHAPTLDPHMHFERVGILVNINMFDSLLHRNTKMDGWETMRQLKGMAGTRRLAPPAALTACPAGRGA